MANFGKKETSIVSLTMFLALAAVTSELIEASITTDPVLAQAAASGSFQSPAAVPSGTTVRIDGTSSMETANEALKKRFEQQFPDAKVEIYRRGSDTAVKELVERKIDLAAVGRPLTAQEKAQGLVQFPLGRQKIAVIVGPNNPFKGSLTFDQFARIYRGQITNWSQVGGTPGPIVLIDRPDGSDTRRAFQSYKVFQNAPFKTGSNTKKIGGGSTAEVIRQLGRNGISYAIADQVLGRNDVRVLRMHNVLPSSPKYPFSQTLSYVYKTPDPSPVIPLFLGFATARSNKAIVQQALGNTATIIAPTATDSGNTALLSDPSAGVETATSEQGFPWWLLLLLGIPILGGLLWWLLKDREEDREDRQRPIAASSVGTVVAPIKPEPVAPVPAPAPSHTFLLLVPYDGKNAYAYWQIAPRDIEALQRQGGEKLTLRLYDVTNIPEGQRYNLQSLQQFGCQTQQDYLLLTLPAEYREYIAELGYFNQTGGWIPLTRSATVRVTPSIPKANIVAVETSNGGGWVTQSTGSASLAAAPSHSRLFLVPYDGKNAYAYWEIAPREIEALKRQGGEKLMLRLYDVTDIKDLRHLPQSIQELDCNTKERYLVFTLPAENRDYIVELGYLTQAGNWLSLTRSGTVRVAPTIPTDDIVLTLMLRDSKNIYAYWEIPPVAIEALKHQGGKANLADLIGHEYGHEV